MRVHHVVTYTADDAAEYAALVARIDASVVGLGDDLVARADDEQTRTVTVEIDADVDL